LSCTLDNENSEQSIIILPVVWCSPCSADEDIDSKYPTNVIVSSDGTCSWVPLGLYISSCSIDITWFPFDDQNCTMKFGSWTYDGGSINLTKKEDSVDLSIYQESGEWDLIGIKTIKKILFKL